MKFIGHFVFILVLCGFNSLVAGTNWLSKPMILNFQECSKNGEYVTVRTVELDPKWKVASELVTYGPNSYERKYYHRYAKNYFRSFDLQGEYLYYTEEKSKKYEYWMVGSGEFFVREEKNLLSKWWKITSRPILKDGKLHYYFEKTLKPGY